MNIGDLIFRLLADGSQLTPSVQKEAEKAGDAGAKTLGQRLSSGLKTNGLRAFGAVATTVFAGAAKGALELEDIQARFQAETGASADEAAHAAQVINKAAGDNRLSLLEVADAAEKVHNDLGLTGDAADQATMKFAEYARVTRQEAGAAVSAFDDILDSWGLTAKDATGLMDRLIVSHQKFGGSVAENQVTLAALAPAMRAANMSIDDGIALLNVFGAKGLDAGQASAAFAKALTKVKSPAELQRLITDISNTKDPFERAAKAADLFGAKAGAKLANALDGVDLESYKVGMEEAAGATDKAAEAADSGFGNTFRKLMSQARAAVRGFGAEWGPAATGIAAIGSLVGTVFPGFGGKLIGAIGGGWKKVAASSVVSKAIAYASGKAATLYLAGLIAGDKVTSLLTGFWSKLPLTGPALAGTKAGTAFAAAAYAAIIAAPVAVLAVAIQFQSEIDTQGAALLQQTRDFAKKATDKELANAIAGVQAQLDGMVFNSYDSKNKVIGVLNALIEESNSRATQVPAAVGAGIASNADAVTPGMQAMGQSVLDSVDTVGPLAEALGQKIPESVAAGILAKQNEPVDAMNTLKELMKNALTPSQEIARNIGILTSKELAKGLKDRRPAVRQEAQRVQAVAEQALAELIAGGGKAGKGAMEELRKKMHSKNPAVRRAAQRVYSIVTGKLNAIKKPAGDAGSSAGSAFISNFKQSISAGGIVTIKVRTSDDTKGGKAVGGPVRKGEPWWVGERGPEIFVPNVDGRVLTAAQSRSVVSGSGGMSAVGGRGGDSITIPVSVQGALPVRTIRDISREMQRVARLGLVPEARLSPTYRREEATR